MDVTAASDITISYRLQSKSLEATALLAFLTAAVTTSSLVQRISFKLCSRIGLQVRSLFVGMACLTYVLAIFMHQNVLAMFFVLLVDKVLSCVHETELDKTFTERLEKRVSLEWLSLPGPIQATDKSFADAAGADKLMDKLAKAVVNLNDAVAESRRSASFTGAFLHDHDSILCSQK
ncbi:hypothetical protein V5799_006678 [Amblyomma americanum]|uniref:Uncharacterized protein n=1 Tax=Amblyomma americanum TaxID=6943 RepID=A0AAQ4DVP6_AMBAM